MFQIYGQIILSIQNEIQRGRGRENQIVINEYIQQDLYRSNKKNLLKGDGVLPQLYVVFKFSSKLHCRNLLSGEVLLPVLNLGVLCGEVDSSNFLCSVHLHISEQNFFLSIFGSISIGSNNDFIFSNSSLFNSIKKVIFWKFENNHETYKFSCKKGSMNFNNVDTHTYPVLSTSQLTKILSKWASVK